jgi:hypothetical protein
MNHGRYSFFSLNVQRHHEHDNVARDDVKVQIVDGESTLPRILLRQLNDCLEHVPEIARRRTQDIEVLSRRSLTLILLRLEYIDRRHVTPHLLHPSFLGRPRRVLVGTTVAKVMRLAVRVHKLVFAGVLLVGRSVCGLAGFAAVLDEPAAGADEVGGVGALDVILDIGAHGRVEVD